MDDRTYSGYLLFAIVGSAFAVLYNYLYLSVGLYHRYLSALVGMVGFVWFAVNLSLIFIEGLEALPDLRKLFLPSWYVVGYLIAAMYMLYNIQWVPSYLLIGTTFANWWVVGAIIAGLFELLVANMILWRFNVPAYSEEL